MSTQSSRLAAFIGLTLFAVVAVSSAQYGPGDRLPQNVLSGEPQTFSSGGERFRAVPLKGFLRPFSIAFLPTGDALVTERGGQLRIVRDPGKNATIDPQPISGIPKVWATQYQGLWDVVLHPNFAQNKWVYFTYAKVNPNEGAEIADKSAIAVLARGTYDGAHALTDVKDLFASNAYISGVSISHLAFAPDGKLFMSIGAPSRDTSRGGPNRVGTTEVAQDPGSYGGKILRLNDDGSAPADNPFIGKAGYKPEIYAIGVRDPSGLFIHPTTGELWEVEFGPQGGDELNIIKAGHNYGWPHISLGRSYNGDLTQSGSGPEMPEPCAPGMDQPFLFWSPQLNPSGLIIYNGDKFPLWRNSIFIGALRNNVHLQRVILNGRGLPIGQAQLLGELRQRIRAVKQGPDGLIYLLTDHADQQDKERNGAMIRLEPVAAGAR
jgi:glucose/arabinose dehydrogenase